MKISDILQYVFTGIAIVVLALMIKQWDECNGLFVRTLFWFECVL